MPSGSKNTDSLDLLFERIDASSILSNFYCGIKEMDDFIHEKFHSYLSRTDGEAYIVKNGEAIVAMLSLGEDTLCLDEDDKDDMRSGFIPKPDIALENHEFLSENEFPAIEITYLAVDENWRGQGIGEFIISQIEMKVQKDRPDCEFLTVEAYKTDGYSAVGFYSHCDFTPAELPLGYKDTLRMYKVIRPIRLEGLEPGQEEQ